MSNDLDRRPFPFDVRRAELTKRHVEAAIEVARSGVCSATLEISDAAMTHLALRVRDGAVQWLWRTHEQSIVIDSATRTSLNEARARARKANSLRETGNGAADFIKLRRKGVPVVAAEREAEKQDRYRVPSWTLRQIFDAYLDSLQSADAKPRRKSTMSEIRRALTRLEIVFIDKIPAAALSLEHLEVFRKAFWAPGMAGRNVASKAVRHVKAALNWCWTNHRAESGLQIHSHKFWDYLEAPSCARGREHVPTINELARTLVIAEFYRSRNPGKRGTGDSAMAAFWALILSGQRTAALCSLRRSNWVELENRPGWRIAIWPSETMKSKRLHIVPFPPSAVAAISKYAPPDGEGEYLFPSPAVGKKISPNALNKIIYRLQGKKIGARATLIPPDQPHDLLDVYLVRPFVLHDIRRTIATELDERELGAHASAILDHEDNRNTKKDTEAVRSAVSMGRVTRLVYSKAQRISVKAEGMATWCELLLAAYEAEKANFRPFGSLKRKDDCERAQRYRETAKRTRRRRRIDSCRRSS